MTKANGIARCRAQRELPDWLDRAVETRHADLALAILSAFVEAQRISAPQNQASVPVRADPSPHSSSQFAATISATSRVFQGQNGYPPHAGRYRMSRSPRSGWRADIMTSKSISRIAIALVAILATGGIVFAIQYFHGGPPADANTVPATTTDTKPAAPIRSRRRSPRFNRQRTLWCPRSAGRHRCHRKATTASRHSMSPVSNHRAMPSSPAGRRRVRRWNCCAMASRTIAPSPISPVNLSWWCRGFRQAPTT